MTTTETATTPTPETLEAETRAVDLDLRRAELKEELNELTRKSRDYGNELYKDGQSLLSHTWDYAKAAWNVGQDRVLENVKRRPKTETAKA
jgi:hypothetical protein